MYLRSENAGIAAYLSTPDTHFALDYVRPDFIMLRVISRNLIMWDEVRTTREWVLKQIPDVISANIEGSTVSSVARMCINDDACEENDDSEDVVLNSDSKRNSGNAEEQKLQASEGPSNRKVKTTKRNGVNSEVHDLDLEAIRQSFCYIIAGACMSIGNSSFAFLTYDAASG